MNRWIERVGRDRRPLAFRHNRGLLAVAAVMLSSGCQLFTGSDRNPTSVALSSERISFDAVTETRTIGAEVFDQDGAAMPNARVTWTSMNPSVVSVDDDGVVTAVGNGRTSVVASAGRASSEIPVEVQQVVLGITLVGGGDQAGEVGTPLTGDVEVLLVDRLGSPAVDAEVSFEVVLGGGSVEATTTVTDSDGVAAGSWTLGETAGSPQRLEASVSANPELAVLATATAFAGPAEQVVKSAGDEQAAPRQTPLAEPMFVSVLDRFGNPVEGALVSWDVTGGSGAVTPPAGLSGPDGRAGASWSLGPELGDQSLSASVEGTEEPAVFSAVALAIPAALQPVVGDGQSGVVGQPVPTLPSVRVVDATGLPVPFTDVTFSVTSGDGSVAPAFESPGPSATPAAVVQTDLDGVARPSAWLLGTTAGENVLRAEVSGIPPVFFSAAGLAGPPAHLVKVDGDGQTGPVNSVLSEGIVVRVSDQFGNLVGGVGVDFTPAVGSGAAAPTSAVAAQDGTATTTWTLGPGAGTQQLSVTAAGLEPVVFSATATAVGGGGGGGGGLGYDIVYEYTVPVAPNIEAVFDAAAARWASVITGDLPDANVPGGWCGDSLPNPSTVDDLYVVVTIAPIDGVGSVLGQAGPCLIRSVGSLTAIGRMTLDLDDVNNLYSTGKLEAVVLHELGHIIGIGTLWNYFGLLQNPSLPSSPGVDTHFSGAGAIAAFDAVGGAGYPDAKVPVENTQGGTGTRDAHWREDVFENELMTGYLSGGSQPLSRVTVASLEDLGYSVDEGAADGFSLPAAAPPAAAPLGFAPIPLEEEILRPIGTVDPSGGVAPIPPPP